VSITVGEEQVMGDESRYGGDGAEGADADGAAPRNPAAAARPPLRRAVGVAYEPGSVPTLVVKGAGREADSLLAQAGAADIPVVHDGRLLGQLYRLPVDAPIGRDLFPVMAALIAHVLIVDREAARAAGGRT
jgi:type III secretion system FlhB-like substrate exporter